jgi:hypothetical protein
LGLLGNYLVLFAYWFIENKIKQIIQKYRHWNLIRVMVVFRM